MSDLQTAAAGLAIALAISGTLFLITLACIWIAVAVINWFLKDLWG